MALSVRPPRSYGSTNCSISANAFASVMTCFDFDDGRAPFYPPPALLYVTECATLGSREMNRYLRLVKITRQLQLFDVSHMSDQIQRGSSRRWAPQIY